jgi:hypothetical protein
MKLLAEARLSVVSDTMQSHPFCRARDSTARISRNCKARPQCLLSTPTRQKYPEFAAWLDKTTPANATGIASWKASHQWP